MNDTLWIGAGLGAVLGVAILFTFERPPVINVQRGFRGTAMEEVYNPRRLAADMAKNTIPASLPQLQVGPYASTVYKNVQVLKNVRVGEFTRLMASMTAWVAPQQGCSYCHSLNNMASDSLYTKVVARRMLQMVQHINGTWTSHVQNVGVTCYTCHRGNPVPLNVWFHNNGPEQAGGFAETGVGKNLAIGPDHSSLPFDPYTMFLEDNYNIRVQSMTALPAGDHQSIKQTDWTYALMIHFSESLGVNCSYCHNTRAFDDWSQSSPQRVTAWYGIRMARDLNNNYLDKLQGVFPPLRLGPTGDVAKVNCNTCHQGAFKPLYGVAMAPNYPELYASAETAAVAIPVGASQPAGSATPSMAPGAPQGAPVALPASPSGAPTAAPPAGGASDAGPPASGAPPAAGAPAPVRPEPVSPQPATPPT
jgi:photosynthetic reaction center cytochrome c subunit